jgi:hypothetical protein
MADQEVSPDSYPALDGLDEDPNGSTPNNDTVMSEHPFLQQFQAQFEQWSSNWNQAGGFDPSQPPPSDDFSSQYMQPPEQSHVQTSFNTQQESQSTFTLPSSESIPPQPVTTPSQDASTPSQTPTSSTPLQIQAELEAQPPVPETRAPPQSRFSQKPEQRSELQIIEERLKADRNDNDAWKSLIAQSEQTADLDKIKDAYERLLEVFPNTVRRA